MTLSPPPKRAVYFVFDIFLLWLWEEIKTIKSIAYFFSNNAVACCLSEVTQSTRHLVARILDNRLIKVLSSWLRNLNIRRNVQNDIFCLTKYQNKKIYQINQILILFQTYLWRKFIHIEHYFNGKDSWFRSYAQFVF